MIQIHLTIMSLTMSIKAFNYFHIIGIMYVENVIQDYDIFSMLFDEKIVSTWILNSLSYEAQAINSHLN